MCVALPMQVLAMEGEIAICQSRNGVERLNTLLTGRLQPGDWVLGFLGSAREVIDADRAAQVNAALEVVAATMHGTPASAAELDALINTHFADLVGREPELPAFLRKENR